MILSTTTTLALLATLLGSATAAPIDSISWSNPADETALTPRADPLRYCMTNRAPNVKHCTKLLDRISGASPVEAISSLPGVNGTEICEGRCCIAWSDAVVNSSPISDLVDSMKECTEECPAGLGCRIRNRWTLDGTDVGFCMDQSGAKRCNNQEPTLGHY